jgi:hypothetical protein
LIGIEVAVGDGVGAGDGLLEREAESIAGDGLDGAGGIANEGDVVALDVAEAAGGGNGAAFDGRLFGVLKSVLSRRY